MKTKTYSQYKYDIRREIYMELAKDTPDYKKVKELYKKIENPNKVVQNTMADTEKKKVFNRVERYGKDHHRFINVLEKDEYIQYKLDGKNDKDIAEMLNVSVAKMNRLKQSWGLAFHYKKSMVTLNMYNKLREQGKTLDEIAVIFRMDRSTLYCRRTEWGVVGDKGVNGK